MAGNEPKQIINNIKEEIKRKDEEVKSKATKVNNLIFKQKEWLSNKNKVVNFQEPVMFFKRRNGKVEFYENVTAGIFEYQHSDGEKRFQIVDTKQQDTFGFGDYLFKGYVSHEDYPVVGFPDPILTVEQVNIVVEKSLNDYKNWKAKELKAQGNLIWKVLIGIAIILAIIFIGPKIFGGGDTPTNTVIQVINNTPTILGSIIAIKNKEVTRK